jgi:hypothetical protein
MLIKIVLRLDLFANCKIILHDGEQTLDLSESEYLEDKVLVLKKLKELCKEFGCFLVCYVQE